MGILDWINGLRNASVRGAAADQEITRWQKALSDLGYPYDLVSGSTVDEAFAAAKELGGQNGFIVCVPAASPDELPAYFQWGGWNSTPSPEMIVAVARHWRQAYGSELVAMGPDLLEFNVPRPPQDHASAVSLLKEHYVFSPDSFEFDPEYLERAAARLRADRSWVFWWD
ncbi:DUF4253 domain-containing protein [Bradyrhizobium cenepequi]|uniref:DUF4253 domain-containing protein n=1 Tax=Bradyrhizobium cenepequi TaxID=2821403 RepID=UPI001CE251A9|nr:DUF4253 domain-containing protein [Bradyrhizobium cenepequi]MCA6110673.1 DUF4253 domain-containing protein [Bradyrhizobium cenepequi]